MDYFWRVEFQLQGSPMCIWVKDAPDLQTVEGLRASLTSISPLKYPLKGMRTLVMRLQGHEHTHTCQKNAHIGPPCT